jgi:hypothetical protein
VKHDVNDTIRTGKTPTAAPHEEAEDTIEKRQEMTSLSAYVFALRDPAMFDICYGVKPRQLH